MDMTIIVNYFSNALTFFSKFIFLQVLTHQREDLDLDLSNLLSSCEFVENILRYGNEAEIMTVKKLMMSRLNELNNHQPQLEPEENDVIDFYRQDEDVTVSNQSNS